MEANNGSERPQQIHQKDVSDAVTSRNSPDVAQRRLYGIARSLGCLFPHPNSHQTQAVSAIHSGGAPLSVQSVTLWPQVRSEGIHKLHGAGSNAFTAAKPPDISISRRLAYKGCFIQDSAKGSNVLHEPIPKTRTQNQQREVFPITGAVAPVLKSQITNSRGKSVPLRRAHAEDKGISRPAKRKKVHFSENLQIFTGNDIFLHSTGPQLSTPYEATARVTRQPMDSSQRIFRGPNYYQSSDQTSSVMVEHQKQLSTRSNFRTPSSKLCHDIGCFIERMGSASSGAGNTGSLDRTRNKASHQHAGAKSGISGPARVPAQDSKLACLGENRQYNNDVLLNKTGRHKIKKSLGEGDLEMVDTTQHFPAGATCSWSAEHESRLSEQIGLGLPRVGTESVATAENIRSLGYANVGLIRNSAQQEGQSVRKPILPKGIVGKCASHLLDRNVCIRISPIPSHSKDPAKNESGTMPFDSYSPGLAYTVLVLGSPPSVSMPQNTISAENGSNLHEKGQVLHPRLASLNLSAWNLMSVNCIP